MDQESGLTHPLDRLIEREAFAEIVALLGPGELLVAALRLEGLTDGQIGALLGVTRATVSYRLQQARRRIMAERPDLAPWLRGRQRSRVNGGRLGGQPLARGWLCHQPPAPEALSVREAARRLGVSVGTVWRWVRDGRFPRAYRASGVRGDFRIPEEDVLAVAGELGYEWHEAGKSPAGDPGETRG
jgi:excisionase family DNA binding protein